MVKIAHSRKFNESEFAISLCFTHHNVTLWTRPTSELAETVSFRLRTTIPVRLCRWVVPGSAEGENFDTAVPFARRPVFGVRLLA